MLAKKRHARSFERRGSGCLPALVASAQVVAVQLSAGPIMVGHVAADEVKTLKVDALIRMIYMDHADGYRIPGFEIA
jgi:hypothetical protein